MTSIMKTLNFAGSLLFAAMIFLMIFLAFFVVKGKLEGGVPTVAGNKLYIVLSGSMSPVFDAGSVIGVKTIAPENVKTGDIITFKDPADQNRIITHRVLEIKNENGQLSFITKGDANDGKDTTPVSAGNILGQATFWVPYVGYVVDFAKSKKGIVLLLVVPGVLFILNELRNLYKYAVAYEEEQKRRKSEEANQINT
ncbi:MAG: signal peptidase I [Bacillota bacterium]